MRAVCGGSGVLRADPGREGDQEGKGFKLDFRFYQRVEGTFRVAAGTVVKSMQVRVFENGSKEAKLTQTANAS